MKKSLNLAKSKHAITKTTQNQDVFYEEHFHKDQKQGYKDIYDLIGYEYNDQPQKYLQLEKSQDVNLTNYEKKQKSLQTSIKGKQTTKNHPAQKIDRQNQKGINLGESSQINKLDEISSGGKTKKIDPLPRLRFKNTQYNINAQTKRDAPEHKVNFSSANGPVYRQLNELLDVNLAKNIKNQQIQDKAKPRAVQNLGKGKQKKKTSKSKGKKQAKTNKQIFRDNSQAPLQLSNYQDEVQQQFKESQPKQLQEKIKQFDETKVQRISKDPSLSKIQKGQLKKPSINKIKQDKQNMTNNHAAHQIKSKRSKSSVKDSIIQAVQRFPQSVMKRVHPEKNQEQQGSQFQRIDWDNHQDMALIRSIRFLSKFQKKQNQKYAQESQKVAQNSQSIVQNAQKIAQKSQQVLQNTYNVLQNILQNRQKVSQTMPEQVLEKVQILKTEREYCDPNQDILIDESFVRADQQDNSQDKIVKRQIIILRADPENKPQIPYPTQFLELKCMLRYRSMISIVKRLYILYEAYKIHEESFFDQDTGDTNHISNVIQKFVKFMYLFTQQYPHASRENKRYLQHLFSNSKSNSVSDNVKSNQNQPNNFNPIKLQRLNSKQIDKQGVLKPQERNRQLFINAKLFQPYLKKIFPINKRASIKFEPQFVKDKSQQGEKTSSLNKQNKGTYNEQKQTQEEQNRMQYEQNRMQYEQNRMKQQQNRMKQEQNRIKNNQNQVAEPGKLLKKSSYPQKKLNYWAQTDNCSYFQRMYKASINFGRLNQGQKQQQCNEQDISTRGIMNIIGKRYNHEEILPNDHLQAQSKKCHKFESVVHSQQIQEITRNSKDKSQPTGNLRDSHYSQDIQI